MTTTTNTTRRTTKKEYFNMLLEIPAVGSNPELAAFIRNEISQLDKKNASDKPSAKKIENNGYKALILDYLRNNDRATITQLWKNIPELATNESMTNQRISRLVSAMVDEQLVIRSVDKRVAYFSIA